MKKALVFTIFLSGSVLADQASINSIELAAMQLDTKQLTELVQSNQGYDRALAQYRLAITQNLHAESKKALANLNLAMAELENITDQSPDNDEAWALLAQVYGLKIAFEPVKGPYYGPKSGAALRKAKSINPENPRVYLVQGISDFNTPTLFGGSKSSALKALDKAIKLFEQDKNSGNHWGEAEAYVWRGLTHLEKGKDSQALADWQSAIDIAPDYGWPQMLTQKNQ